MKKRTENVIWNIVAISLYVSPAMAEEVIGSNVMESYSMEALKVVLSLGVVLLLFYFGASVFKKYAGSAIKSNSSIRVLGGLSLGSKDRVVLIEAGKINLLLGISAAGVTKLHQFKDSELEARDHIPEENGKKLLNFGHHLEKMMGRR